MITLRHYGKLFIFEKSDILRIYYNNHLVY
nr:MAG TPA: hypothetical protein [Caudoviricetes sp.]